MSRCYRWSLVALLLPLAPLHGATDNNTHGWFMYFGDHPIAKTRWGIHLEGQWRRANVVTQWQQLLLRPGINFQLNPKIALTGGYAHVRTHPYGDYPAAAVSPEHRLFQQATVTQRIWKLDFQNRLRQEQRFLGTMARQPDGTYKRESWRYENRFRYMLRTNIPLPFADKKYYVGLYDEIFINFGKNVTNNVFDQNRAYIALGRNLPKQTRIEVGFMEQTVQQRSGQVFEHNHTLQLSIVSRLPFGD